MKAEIRFSIIFFVIVFILFLQSLQNPIFRKGREIGAGYFPFFVSLLTLILLTIHLVLLIKKSRSREARTKVKQPRGVIAAQILLISLTLISILVAKYLGVLLTMGLFLVLTFTLIEKLPWKQSIILSVVSIVAIYLIFDKWLGLNLPMGIFT